MNNSKTAEALLFDRATSLGCSPSEAAPLFLLGAPRTGSTFLYQLLSHKLDLLYISNLINDYYFETPVVGLAIQNSVPEDFSLESSFGKTKGPFQVSEGSALMTRWFGGGHPSAIVSASVLSDMERHFLETLAAAEVLFGRSVMIKNAWNCFRVPYLAKAFPSARFVWIKRDIADAAKSDLSARYQTKGRSDLWNSATPANIDQLMTLPPTAQVVENQYEFNHQLEVDLRAVGASRYIEVQYEELCLEPEKIIRGVSEHLSIPMTRTAFPMLRKPKKNWVIDERESLEIDLYIEENWMRLQSLIHGNSA